MLNLQSIYFGQKHKDFDYKDFDIIKRVQRLTRKHYRQAENDCNGEGYVKGKFYRCDGSVEGAYIDESTVFEIEMNAIEIKITELLIKNNKNNQWKVEFQGDPRGATVKLYYETKYIEL